MTDDFAVEGGTAGYVPCGDQAAALVGEEEGAISGRASGRVAVGQSAGAAPAEDREAIVGSGVGFVAGPCCDFLVIGGGGPAQISSSSDGITWVARDPAGLDNGPSATGAVRGLAQSSATGVFVAVGGLTPGGAVASSPDGATWTTRGLAQILDSLGNPENILGRVVYSPELGLFVVSGNTDQSVHAVWTSPDGTTWTPRVIPIAPGVVAVYAWSPELGIFVGLAQEAGGTGTIGLTSPDGITWTNHGDVLPLGFAVAVSPEGSSIAWSPELGIFVTASGSTRAYSADGVTWTTIAQQTPSGKRITWVADLGSFFHGSTTGRIVTSPDGLTWTDNVINLSTFFVYAFAWSAELGLLFAVGSTLPGVGLPGRLASSPDGITWTDLVSNIGDGVNADSVLCIVAGSCT